MNEELDSQLSAMFDDELSPAECELLARRLSRDEQLTARWGRYAVIGAAIRAERGVRLNARVAPRVSALVRSEPVFGGQPAPEAPRLRWRRPVAGAAVAAGVAAVSILWLRSQVPEAGRTATAQLVAVTRSAAPRDAADAVPAAQQAVSYIVPPAPRAPAAVVPATELANFVVAHSVFTPPMARGNLLSSFVTSESAAAVSAPAPVEPPQDPQRDAPAQAQ
jgi:sigma-E factor negative regulatory protein RseA